MTTISLGHDKQVINRKIKVARVSTVPFFIDSQLGGQLQQLIDKEMEVTAVASDGDWTRLQKIVGLKCVKINISRAPSLIKDVISIIDLFKLFKKSGFDIVHSTTPKAGLVCAVASKLARTQVRLHTFTGQTWATKQGLVRQVLKLIDKVILMLMTQCYADSESQKQFLIAEGIGGDKSIKVLGQGSLAGVDMKRFEYIVWESKEAEIKAELEIGDNDFVMTFIGRLTRDKGIFELIEAFNILRQRYDDIHLLLVGPCENNESVTYTKHPNIHVIGETKVPEKYLAISNLLCLPSYREGFGTVVIEAAAMKVPTIGSNIVGLTDAIDNKITGVLVKPKDVEALTLEIEKLIVDKGHCNELGQKAYERCKLNFESQKVGQMVIGEYFEQLTR